jgi:hypothetical protein
MNEFSNHSFKYFLFLAGKWVILRKRNEPSIFSLKDLSQKAFLLKIQDGGCKKWKQYFETLKKDFSRTGRYFVWNFFCNYNSA